LRYIQDPNYSTHDETSTDYPQTLCNPRWGPWERGFLKSLIFFVVVAVEFLFYWGFLCIFFSLILLLYWEYLVIFTKVVTIYHCWIHLLHHYPLSSFPHSWRSFKRSHFSIFIHEYIIFPPYSSSYTLSLYPLPPTDINPRQDLSSWGIKFKNTKATRNLTEVFKSSNKDSLDRGKILSLF
jgi:hypothetical protein